MSNTNTTPKEIDATKIDMSSAQKVYPKVGVARFIPTIGKIEIGAGDLQVFYEPINFSVMKSAVIRGIENHESVRINGVTIPIVDTQAITDAKQGDKVAELMEKAEFRGLCISKTSGELGFVNIRDGVIQALPVQFNAENEKGVKDSNGAIIIPEISEEMALRLAEWNREIKTLKDVDDFLRSISDKGLFDRYNSDTEFKDRAMVDLGDGRFEKRANLENKIVYVPGFVDICGVSSASAGDAATHANGAYIVEHPDGTRVSVDAGEINKLYTFEGGEPISPEQVADYNPEVTRFGDKVPGIATTPQYLHMVHL